MFGGVELVVGMAVFLLIASVSPRAASRWFWRARRVVRKSWFRSRMHRERATTLDPVVLNSVRVIDGDTVEDRLTRIRYRIENIDSPETGDNAKCHRERVQGEIATKVASKLFAQAQQVIARPIARKDVYGRTVARIELDGQDFGTIMIQRGYARPWKGMREAWCGPQGGLAAMARARSAEWDCRACQTWKAGLGGEKQNQQFVPISVPAAARESNVQLWLRRWVWRRL